MSGNNVSEPQSIEEYLEVANQNHIAFTENLIDEMRIFLLLDTELQSILNHIIARPELTDDLFKRAAMTFFLIIHRQFRSGFELMKRYIPWDAGAVIRVAIESLKHYFRITKNPDLFEDFIGSKGKKKQKQFVKASIPEDLPNSKFIISTWNIINEMASHPDLKYWMLGTDISKESVFKVDYFNRDYDIFRIFLIRFLLLYWHIIGSIRVIISDQLPMSMTARDSSWVNLNRELDSYVAGNKQWYNNL